MILRQRCVGLGDAGGSRCSLATERGVATVNGVTSIERTDYQQVGHTPVTLYTVTDGVHTMPGPKKAPWIMGRSTPNLVAADVIADFFTIGL